MKPSLPSLLCALAIGLVLTPAVSFADSPTPPFSNAWKPASTWPSYQSADVALDKLEAIVTLTPAQQKQALQIYQNLKDVMAPADRAILTRDQQAVYDSTPQRLGGDAKNDPVMRTLNQKIRAFVTGSAGIKTFKISWDMNEAGEMTVTKVEIATR